VSTLEELIGAELTRLKAEQRDFIEDSSSYFGLLFQSRKDDVCTDSSQPAKTRETAVRSTPKPLSIIEAWESRSETSSS